MGRRVIQVEEVETKVTKRIIEEFDEDFSDYEKAYLEAGASEDDFSFSRADNERKYEYREYDYSGLLKELL